MKIKIVQQGFQTTSQKNGKTASIYRFIFQATLIKKAERSSCLYLIAGPAHRNNVQELWLFGEAGLVCDMTSGLASTDVHNFIEYRLSLRVRPTDRVLNC